MSIRSRSKLAALLVAIATTSAPLARAQPEDAMAPYRERFRSGMERYTAGDVAAALRFWEPIYRELGPSKGYRLSFNLARAYEKFGDLTRAAERYESFLAEVDARRRVGETIEPKVATEEQETQQRIAEIFASHGRITIAAGATATAVQIDTFEPRLPPFTILVAPGAHTVTFGAGTADAAKRDVTVAAGQVVELAPPPPPAPPPAIPAPAPAPQPPTRIIHEISHTFPAPILYVAGGATVVSIAVCLVEYTRALSIKHDFETAAAASRGEQQARIDDYGDARPAAYVTLGISIGLTAITAGLTTWYIAGTKERDVTLPAGAFTPSVAPTITPLKNGVSFGLVGRF